MAYLLGIDVGTTNIKALVYDAETGQVISVSSNPTPLSHPRPEWTEFLPDELWAAVVHSVRDVLSQVPGTEPVPEAQRRVKVAAVSVSSMGEAATPLDRDDASLYPFIAWHDPRTEPQARWWEKTVGAEKIHSITGQMLSPIFGVHKMLWLQENRPEIFQNMRHWLCVEDYIIWRLARVYATDYSLASRTMLFDQAQRNWSDELLEIAGISAQVFPPAYPSGTAVGQVTAEAARETGLPQGITVATGGHDHLCAALAMGMLDPGDFLVSIGTSETLVSTSSEFHGGGRVWRSGLCCYCHTVRDRYIFLGGLYSAGSAVDWLGRLVTGTDTRGETPVPYEELLQEARQARGGEVGVFWLPHFRGSGPPYEDPASRGALIGATPDLGRGELLRALLEGLAFWLRENLDELQAITGVRSAELLAVGGGTRNELLLELIAAACDARVTVPDLREATALGAALLAGVGAGVFADEGEAAGSVRYQSKTYQAAPDQVARYDQLYRRVYKELYPTLRDLNRTISELAAARS
jgi:xylulokinase